MSKTIKNPKNYFTDDDFAPVPVKKVRSKKKQSESERFSDFVERIQETGFAC